MDELVLIMELVDRYPKKTHRGVRQPKGRTMGEVKQRQLSTDPVSRWWVYGSGSNSFWSSHQT